MSTIKKISDKKLRERAIRLIEELSRYGRDSGGRLLWGELQNFCFDVTGKSLNDF